MLKRILDIIHNNASHSEEFTPYPLRARQVNLSGSKFHFSMPENFSQDMPAEDMVENVDLVKNVSLASNGVINIINRWWDYSVNLNGETINGTTRFSIDVLKKSDNSALCLSDADNLIHYEHEDLNNYYQPINQKYIEDGDFESEVLLPIFPTQYRTVKLNDITFINYTLSGGKSSDFYLLPINCHLYLKIGFNFSPASNFTGCASLRKIMASEVERIANTFYVEDREDSLLSQKKS